MDVAGTSPALVAPNTTCAETITRKAAAARVVEATAMNAVSSRSHSGGWVDSWLGAGRVAERRWLLKVVACWARQAVHPRFPLLSCPAVFMLYITGRHEASSTVLQGSLNLVDLAGRCGCGAGGRGWDDDLMHCWPGVPGGVPQKFGCRNHVSPPLPHHDSERLARSQAEGQRQKEACNINKSLSSLGDVFQVGEGGRGYHFLLIDCGLRAALPT